MEVSVSIYPLVILLVFTLIPLLFSSLDHSCCLCLWCVLSVILPFSSLYSNCPSDVCSCAVFVGVPVDLSLALLVYVCFLCNLPNCSRQQPFSRWRVVLK